ncbi:acyl carrier protein [Kibdelosporangium banguiense]|uniref:Acyl carrier protein n=1 Tax=Kibdelosporangium banguiense TaxID=1365924 RepID=A0ABS4TRR1_9PSEU|nr:acyl carrier protein [Kibdelosporangium banguiense]MBP2327109.1 acyl carrier protein [Kibdelosporangium banguiense]
MWDSKFDELLRQYLPYLAADEELTASVPLRELGLDSLAVVELLKALEDTYDVRFEDDALTLETFETPGVLWSALDNVLSVAQPVN